MLENELVLKDVVVIGLSIIGGATGVFALGLNLGHRVVSKGELKEQLATLKMNIRDESAEYSNQLRSEFNRRFDDIVFLVTDLNKKISQELNNE